MIYLGRSVNLFYSILTTVHNWINLQKSTKLKQLGSSKVFSWPYLHKTQSCFFNCWILPSWRLISSLRRSISFWWWLISSWWCFFRAAICSFSFFLWQTRMQTWMKSQLRVSLQNVWQINYLLWLSKCGSQLKSCSIHKRRNSPHNSPEVHLFLSGLLLSERASCLPDWAAASSSLSCTLSELSQLSHVTEEKITLHTHCATCYCRNSHTTPQCWWILNSVRMCWSIFNNSSSDRDPCRTCRKTNLTMVSHCIPAEKVFRAEMVCALQFFFGQISDNMNLEVQFFLLHHSLECVILLIPQKFANDYNF